MLRCSPFFLDLHLSMTVSLFSPSSPAAPPTPASAGLPLLQTARSSSVTWAATDASQFAAYIRKPQSIQPCAKLPAHSTYDDATLAALTAYFATFAPVRNSK
jgi:hypothetical protein